MTTSQFSGTARRMGWLAAGGVGVYVALFLRQAGRRSATTFTRGTGTQVATVTSQPTSQQQQQQQQQHNNLLSPTTNQPLLVVPPSRGRYEVVWRDDWDFEEQQFD